MENKIFDSFSRNGKRVEKEFSLLERCMSADFFQDFLAQRLVRVWITGDDLVYEAMWCGGPAPFNPDVRVTTLRMMDALSYMSDSPSNWQDCAL